MEWLTDTLRAAARRNPGFVVPESVAVPFLPAIQRVAHLLRVRPPLWRHTRKIRKMLKLLGRDL